MLCVLRDDRPRDADRSATTSMAAVRLQTSSRQLEEPADVLQISPQSVMRDWRLARAWLARELGGSPGP